MTAEPLPGLALARSVLDRAAHRRLDDDWLATAWSAQSSRVLRLAGGRSLVTGDPPRLQLATRPDVAADRRFFLGVDGDGSAYFAVVETDDSEAAPVVDDARFLSLRAVAATVPDLEAGLLAHATSLANWHATHRHCPRCGSPTRMTAGGHLRRCDVDGSEHYPRTDPAVIMAVVDDADRLLLGRQATWDEGRFSTLAGFVEPGESLEAAVRREVAEEVGIRIGAVHYLASQPWPFPSSLMLGFTAHAETVEIVRHDGEIAEARWYDRPGLAADIDAGRVHVAPSISISRRLIEHWYGEPLRNNAD